MIRNLFDTFSLLGFLAGLSFGLALIAKFPITGMIVFVFCAMFCMVSLVNAVDDKIKSKRNEPPTD